MPSVGNSPILLLRNLDLKNIFEKFRSGEIFGEEINVPARSVNETFTSLIIPGNRNQEEIYTRINGIKTFVYATSGTNLVKRLNLYGEWPIGGICRYCNDTIKGNCRLMPISFEQYGSGLNTNYVVYTNTERFCNWNCCLAKIIEFSKCSSHRGTEYGNSESIIRLIHKMEGNTETLLPSPHYLMLKENGGPLTSEEYHKSSSKWTLLPNVTYQPVSSILQREHM